MPFPHASSALSRFTVLDLTRVRSGPTCVRQLADWGANVIKIDALMEDAAGEQPGGPRQGSDFQNLHRNKRAMTLNLKDNVDHRRAGRRPDAVGIPVADLTAGLFCAIGILTALLERDVSGEGQWVQTCCCRRRSSCWISRPRAG
jgi:crotonobetainyl-CoA:carnitine CoA-transferase CaiB-like acyl-CoA transferase